MSNSKQGDKRRRRRHQQFKVQMAKSFVQGLLDDTDRWEEKGMTAEEIISEIRTHGNNLGSVLKGF